MISPNKYKNVEYKVNGIKFSSKLEASIYVRLRDLELTNQISNLELQVSYLLLDKFRNPYYSAKSKKLNKTMHREITYVPDFRFNYKGNVCVLEVKGFLDQKYPIKRKLFLNKFGQEILFLEIGTVRELTNLINILEELI